MYSKIIVALSLEHGIAADALKAAKKLLDDGGEMMAVHVVEPVHDTVRAYVSEKDLAAAKNQTLKALEDRAADYPEVQTVLIEGHPGRALTQYAKESGADCIVVGSHKPDVTDFFLGSTAARIVRHAPCAVHVLR